MAFLAAMIAFQAQAEPVKPLGDEDCARVRRALEAGLPFGPGFRRMQVDFPENNADIKGQVCRLLTLGTGVHFEGPKVPTLAAMTKLVMGALRDRGWTVTNQTLLFTENSSPGRHVAALYRNNAICVSTVVIDIVKGITPAPETMKDGKVMLGALKPHQREWWISVDCFSVKPQGETKEKETKKPALKSSMKEVMETVEPAKEEPALEEVVPDPDAPAPAPAP
ncbi:MAG: hypothetical protein O3B76_09630, partial [Proteobacteria bacterium]|nr:hypothetical protein [Pseudomonadota bacterium]